MPIRLSLKHVFFVGALVVAGVYGILQYIAYKEQSIALIELVHIEDMRGMAQASLTDFKKNVQLYEDVLDTVSALLDDVDLSDTEAVQALLHHFFSNFTTLSALYVGTPDNGLIGFSRYNKDEVLMKVAASDPEQTIGFYAFDEHGVAVTLEQMRAGFQTTQRPWYLAALDRTGPVWSDLFYYHIGNTPALPLSVALYNDDGTLRGVVGMNFFLNTVSQQLPLFSNDASVYTAVLDDENRILASTSSTNDQIQSGELQTIIEQLKSAPDNAIQLNRDDGYFLAFQGPTSVIADRDFSVFMMVNLTSLVDRAMDSVRHSAIFNALATCFIVVLLYAYLIHVGNKLKPTLLLLKSKRFIGDDSPIPPIKQKLVITEFQDVHNALLEAYARSQATYLDLQAAQQQIIMYLQAVKRLALVTELTEDLVLQVDNQGRIKWCNASFSEFFNIDNENYEAKTIRSVLQQRGAAESDLQRVDAVFGEELATNEFELTFTTGHTTSYFYVEAKHFTSTDSDDTEFFFVLSNITYLKNQQKALMLWKTIFDKAKWGIAVSHHDSRIFEHINPALCEITGYSHAELWGKPIEFVMSKEMAAELPRNYNTATKNGLVSYQGDIISKSGKRVPVLVSVSMVYDDDGEPLYRIASVQDLSLEIDLINKVEHQSKLSVIGQLTSGIVHDFNNILGSITFNNALVLAEAEKTQSHVQPDIERIVGLSNKIDTAVMAASDLIEQILIFAKNQSNKKVQVNLVALIDETLVVMHRKQTIRCDIAFSKPDAPIYIEGVKSQLMQLILNLITNAEKSILRHKVEQGEITISVSTENHKEKNKPVAVIRVTDNGEGIPIELKNKIFDAFQSFDNNDASTGIGLALVKRVTDLHHGWITVDSKPLEGATFSVFLPLNGQVAAVPTPITAVTDAEPAFFRFVVVDDEVSLLESFKSLLELAGHEVVAFNDSQLALTYLQNHIDEKDVLVTDYVMPNMDGKALVEKVRHESDKLLIIVMTGYADAIDEQEFLNAGADAVMVKPVKVKSLLSEVAKLASERESHSHE